jgi:hypothetical protein
VGDIRSIIAWWIPFDWLLWRHPAFPPGKTIGTPFGLLMNRKLRPMRAKKLSDEDELFREAALETVI